MSVIHEAVKKLRVLLEGSGLEGGVVTLKRNADALRCQYERGVCVEAHFGGGHGQVTTNFPLQAATRISFMYDAPLQSPQERVAALAIINAASGFFVLSRKLHACRPEDYLPCLSELHRMLGTSPVACIGDATVIAREFGDQLTNSPDQAEVILVVADGAIAPSTFDLIDEWRGKKRMIFLGPSFPGLCALMNLEHWCPYGR
jgi:hypothetical protein